MTSQKAGTASPYTNRMNLTYSYSATSGQMGVGSTAGNAGQLMSISGTINGATESAAYTYDNYGRLVTSNQTSNGSSAQRRFAYDRWGNRTGVWDATTGGTQVQSVSLVTSSSIPNNQISSVTTTGTVNYTYDANGNVTNDGVHTYIYDSANRLVSVDSGTTASYAYDHQNRRYKKTVGSTVTDYVWEGGQVIAEHNGSTGASLVDYIQAGSRMVAKSAGGTLSYMLNGQLSVSLTMNTSGTVTGQQGHLPFGEDFAETSTQQKQHFTSYERDSETGTDYAVNRQYNENIGRFNRVDPVAGSSPQGLNRYSYSLNDPINKVDPDGRDSLFISGGHVFLMACSSAPGEGDGGHSVSSSVRREFCTIEDLGNIFEAGNTQTYDPCGKQGQAAFLGKDGILQKSLDEFLNLATQLSTTLINIGDALGTREPTLGQAIVQNGTDLGSLIQNLRNKAMVSPDDFADLGDSIRTNISNIFEPAFPTRRLAEYLEQYDQNRQLVDDASQSIQNAFARFESCKKNKKQQQEFDNLKLRWGVLKDTVNTLYDHLRTIV